MKRKEEEQKAALEAASAEAEKAERSWRWLAGWSGVGVGGAALVAGIAFGAMAAGESSDYESLRDSGGTYDALQEIQDRGQQYEAIQIALMVAGGAVAAAGGALLVWELMGAESESDSARLRMTPVVMKGGGGCSANLTF